MSHPLSDLDLLQRRTLYAEIALGDARSKLAEHPSPLRLTVEILAEIQAAINEAHDYLRGKHDHLFAQPTEPNRDEATT